jgi:cytochrome P450
VLAGFENVEKGDNYVAFHRVLGQGLITADGKFDVVYYFLHLKIIVLSKADLFEIGKKWKRDRKILNPAFGYQYFEGFLKIFNEQSRTMVEVLGDESFTQGQNLLPYITRCTLDSVFSNYLNKKLDKPKEIFKK